MAASIARTSPGTPYDVAGEGGTVQRRLRATQSQGNGRGSSFVALPLVEWHPN
jgi:hypothetical protein